MSTTTAYIKVSVMQEGFDLHFYSFTAQFDLYAGGDNPWPGTEELLRRIFESGNVGALRDNLLYSLSVGDKVNLTQYLPHTDSAVNLGTFTCNPMGWSEAALV